MFVGLAGAGGIVLCFVEHPHIGDDGRVARNQGAGALEGTEAFGEVAFATVSFADAGPDVAFIDGVGEGIEQAAPGGNGGVGIVGCELGIALAAEVLLVGGEGRRGGVLGEGGWGEGNKKPEKAIRKNEPNLPLCHPGKTVPQEADAAGPL